MISAVVDFQNSTITQRAAFFRIIYGFSFLFLPLFFRVFELKSTSVIFSLPTYLIAVPSINCLTTDRGQPLIKDHSISNWRISISFLILGKQLLEPSPHSDKVIYRVFRGLLGVFMLVVGLVFFLLMLPLALLEMVTSRANSVRQTGRYEPFNSNEVNDLTAT